MPDLVADPTCSSANGNQLEKVEQSEDHTGQDPRGRAQRDQRCDYEHHRSPKTAAVPRSRGWRRVNDLGCAREPTDVWRRLLNLPGNLDGSGARCGLRARSQRAAYQAIRRVESVNACRCHSPIPILARRRGPGDCTVSSSLPTSGLANRRTGPRLNDGGSRADITASYV